MTTVLQEDSSRSSATFPSIISKDNIIAKYAFTYHIDMCESLETNTNPSVPPSSKS